MEQMCVKECPPIAENAPWVNTLPPSVLIAEDNLISLKLVSRMMKRMGFQVVGAKNGQLAIDAWDRESFDLVLLDVQMPILDGLDVARHIRASEVNDKSHSGAAQSTLRRRVPIAILTANTSFDQETMARSIGVDDYLLKPCRFDLLRQMVVALGLAVSPEVSSKSA